MKYPLTLCCAAGLLMASNTSHALPVAPEKDIALLKSACLQIAQEDLLPQNEVSTFLLDCVNDQLTERGYQRIEFLDGIPAFEETDVPSESEKSLIEALEESPRQP
ncbi:hypothetical protein [Shewanella gaetbuli]|uniref:Uncharacterized protein n=1 Tax=Shewanella gaetbuli TaxID=220752 RepID=A0A9X1ZSG4_9GAMM|nr:hypothetical protein [Shewanella gaetbuli]MCL1141366.1 hypothetical protein [Shewanella gaetbuli]